jgi:hypothetical protein
VDSRDRSRPREAPDVNSVKAGRSAVIRELQTMWQTRFSGYQICKRIFMLSEEPAGTWKRIGKRMMCSQEALRHVSEARRRIAAADEPDGS